MARAICNGAAFVYIRQSSASQVEHNKESTQRQYALAQRASIRGWHERQVSVVDVQRALRTGTSEK